MQNTFNKFLISEFRKGTPSTSLSTNLSLAWGVRSQKQKFTSFSTIPMQIKFVNEITRLYNYRGEVPEKDDVDAICSLISPLSLSFLLF